jgi:clan AA aspartic protease (TIGR02281 family)
MKNVTNLDVKRHKLGLHKEASVFAILDIYKASGYKTKLELIAVITVLTHTEKTYSDALNFIYKLEKVENTETLISKLSKQVLEAKVLVAKQRQAIELETINEAANKDSSVETPDSETPSFLKIYRNQLITASVFIAFVFSVTFFSKSTAEPIITSKPREAIEKPQKVIYLEDIKGHKFVKTIINKATAIFLLDTGASMTLISDNFLNELLNDGFISRENNYLGIDKFTIANGSIVKGEIWQLPSIKIGEIILYDIKVVALKNINNSGFLLGMSTLKELGNYTIVPNDNKILVRN